ncbi:MAG TPA: DNA repair protein RecO [Candidatus Saccharimonadales bacterium]|nr:DNA repair protein RecO [Candidatus Saccharimonadales bacterium]
MRYFRTEAIILRRTNYGEADRILSIITPDRGKISVIAKGARRPKSKLAGGLELFAVCDINTIEGRGDLAVVTGAQIKQFYGAKILQDYDRMQFAYEILKQINKASETVTSPEFYQLLKSSLASLEDLRISHGLVEVWFKLNLGHLLGEGVNLETDSDGELLSSDQKYDYDQSTVTFFKNSNGRFTGDHIKFLRLAQQYSPPTLHRISGVAQILKDVSLIFYGSS